MHADRRRDSWGNDVKIRLSTILDDKTVMKIRFRSNCRKLFSSKGRTLPFSSPPPETKTPSPGFSLQSTPSPTPPPAQRPRMDVTPTSSTLQPPHTSTPKQPLGPGRPPRVLAPRNARDNAAAGVGRPVDSSKMVGFDRVCEYLETRSGAQHDIRGLMEKLREFSPRGMYCEKSFRSKLVEKYGGAITFTDPHKEKTIVTFNSFANELLHASFKAQGQSVTQDLDRAADRILHDIKCMDCSNILYPTLQSMEEGGREKMPEALLYFLEKLLGSGNKGLSDANRRRCLAFANFITAAVRPRTFLSPLQLPLSVYLHRNFASRELFTVLNSLGVTVPYSETLRNVAM